jgi:hypothetical protein
MTTPIYVNFHTTDAGYTAEAMELGKTLDDFGLRAEIIAVPPFSSWTEACAYKPVFLQSMRQKHGARPLVWLDADARVRQYPRLFLDMPPDVDFAAHWKDDEELLSGTLYFGATPAADRLLTAWAKSCSERPGDWDQRVLQDLVDGMKAADLKVEHLPPTYTQIYDLMASAGEPVIEHMQASRRLRH